MTLLVYTTSNLSPKLNSTGQSTEKRGLSTVSHNWTLHTGCLLKDRRAGRGKGECGPRTESAGESGAGGSVPGHSLHGWPKGKARASVTSQSEMGFITLRATAKAEQAGPRQGQAGEPLTGGSKLNQMQKNSVAYANNHFQKFLFSLLF